MSCTPRRRFGLAQLAVAAMLAACTSQNPDNLVASARTQVQRGDLPGAVIELKNALQINPDHAQARLVLGQTLLELEQPALAAVELQKARDAGIAADQVLPSLANALEQSGDVQRLIELDAASNVLGPQARASVKTAVASALIAQGQPDRADEALTDALEADPKHPAAQLHKARAHARRGELDLAIAAAAQLVQHNPDDADALSFQGDLFQIVRGDRKGALEAYRKALTIAPKHLGAHAGIITMALEANDLDAARTRLDALKTVRPTHLQTRFFEARLAAQRGDLRTAAEGTAYLLKAAPRDQRVLLLAASLALRQGEANQAIRHLDRVLQSAPQSVTARRLLARAHLTAGDPEQAYRSLEPLLGRQPGDAQVLLLAGSAAMLTGDRRRAEPLLAQAAKLAPTDAETRAALAAARIGLGDIHAGISQLEAIADSDTGISADVVLVTTLVGRRDFDAALKSVQRLESKLPGQALPLHLRGRILALKGDRAAARASFEKSLVVEPRFMSSVEALAQLDLLDNHARAARQRLEAALAAAPDDARAISALAALDDREGKPTREIADSLSRAIQAHPDDPLARKRLVQFLSQRQDYKAALEAARSATVALPNDIDMLALLAATQLSAGEAQQAISSYSRLATIRPRELRYWIGLAESQLAGGSPAAAIDSAARALTLAPRSVPAIETAVKVDLRNGQIAQAIKRAKALQASDPARPQGWLFEGDIELGRGNAPAAAAAYQVALQKDGSTPVAQRLHVALRQTGDAGRADAFAAGWMKNHHDDTRFLEHLASWAIVDKDLPLASQHLEAAARIAPDNASVLNNLAWVQASLKKAGAAKLAERATRLAPNQPQYFDTWAFALAAEGKFSRAVEIQKKAVALAPEGLGLRFNLARLLLQAEDKSAAREELEALSRAGTSFPLHRQVRDLLATL